MKDININEEGEPTMSVSAGSMSHHDATDGEPCNKRKCKKKKKMSKYQQYKEAMEVYDNEDGWYELRFDSLGLLKKNIINLDIPPTDYEIIDATNIARFQNEQDFYDIEELMYNDGEENEEY